MAPKRFVFERVLAKNSISCLYFMACLFLKKQIRRESSERASGQRRCYFWQTVSLFIFPSTPWTQHLKYKPTTNQMPIDLVESKSNLKFEYQSISLDPAQNLKTSKPPWTTNNRGTRTRKWRRYGTQKRTKTDEKNGRRECVVFVIAFFFFFSLDVQTIVLTRTRTRHVLFPGLLLRVGFTTPSGPLLLPAPPNWEDKEPPPRTHRQKTIRRLRSPIRCRHRRNNSVMKKPRWRRWR